MNRISSRRKLVMKSTRRKFLEKSLALGVTPFIPYEMIQGTASLNQTSNKLNILILGGTSFLGPHQIAYAIKRGHKITTFTRGKTIPKVNAEFFSQVESLIGDREDNLEALKGRKWDVVIDNSGRKVKWTEDTAKLLTDNVGLYMYTSSISVYYPYTGNDFSEERKLVLEMPKEASDDEKATYDYGIMKAQSELAAKKYFGDDRTINIRPTLIVGPGDRTDRFPYWTVRLEKGGEVVIPGKPDEVVQYIDVRDLSEWMIRLAEDKSVGTYNGSGPGFEMTTQAFVHGIHAGFNSPIKYINIDDLEFLKNNGVIGIQPWVIQLPKYAGMSKSDNSLAIQSGLTFRSLSETVHDTKEWWYSDAVTQERRENILSGERSFYTREKEIIQLWKEWKKNSK